LPTESARQLIPSAIGRAWVATVLADVSRLGLTELALRRLGLAELGLTELLVAAQSVLARSTLVKWVLACATKCLARLTQRAAVVGTALVVPDALPMTWFAQWTAALGCAESALIVTRLDAARRLAARCLRLLVVRRLRARIQWLLAGICLQVRGVVRRRRSDRRLC
jgi:hypothetical protein